MHAARSGSVRGRLRGVRGHRRARQRREGHRGRAARRRAAAARRSATDGRPAGIRRAEGKAPRARGTHRLRRVRHRKHRSARSRAAAPARYRLSRPSRAGCDRTRGARASRASGAHAADGRPARGRVVRCVGRDRPRVRRHRPPQRPRQTDRHADAHARRHGERLRIPVEPRELRARAQIGARRHSDGRDDLRAVVARDRDRAAGGAAARELLPRGRLRRLRHRVAAPPRHAQAARRAASRRVGLHARAAARKPPHRIAPPRRSVELPEIRLALLEKRGDRLTHLGRAQHLAELIPLFRHPRGDVRGAALLEERLRRAQRRSRQRDELGRLLRGERVEIRGGQHAVHEADAVRLERVERLAEQQFLRGHLMAGDARQQQARCRLRAQAELRERQRQLRGVGRVDEIAVQQHRHADADGDARDRRDDRLVRAGDLAQELEHGRVLVLRRRLHEIVEIVARAEVAVAAANQDRAHRFVVLRRRERIGHRLVHRRRDRVLLRRARERDRQHAACVFDLDIHLSRLRGWFHSINKKRCASSSPAHRRHPSRAPIRGAR
ncbi:hypothetical protein BURPS1710b_0861 [Burkholderia pseudomallei 1710b]|uniref:Uncharacterized protein n=1 Tax=Burkholderia pseudomallei (strain 1710b) TaxID=320372 RepID=Q3JVY0_BURP1|nr:hypothetical protein BURPS1710b_0861 [Burkholderia pseudomallei 1710b]